MAASVSLEPAGPCCWDEPVRIAVRGLAPEQPVTLRASLRDEKGALFRAHARYCADAGGQLDLARAPALGGSFAGLEPMGLLWALQPDRPFWRLTKRDVQTPLAVELEVLDGHAPEPGQLLARALLERRFLPPGVRRQPVRAGRVRATLFLPPGEPSAVLPAPVFLRGRPLGPCSFPRGSLMYTSERQQRCRKLVREADIRPRPNPLKQTLSLTRPPALSDFSAHLGWRAAAHPPCTSPTVARAGNSLEMQLSGPIRFNPSGL
nr:peroxisomal succinyl-coenzyme A thioesterase-like [Oryctolagus cuniculus]